MSRILVLYGTTEGQTAKIAEAIGTSLRARGHTVSVVDARRAPTTGTHGYDAVVLGASVHMGKHDQHVVEFARQNRAALGRMVSAFFSVSLAAAGDPVELTKYVAEFHDQTGWRPATIRTFGGSLPYTRYGFLKRRLMRRIVKSKPGGLGVDTSRDYDYTDWDAVRSFADEVAQQLVPATKG